MMIKTLFDPSKDIYRTIEKVITYNSASKEGLLKAEISEYIVTENIEEQFERLLRLMRDGLDNGGGNEVGVWVSGFYGSGKSSFTKYLGLALNDRVELDGVPFLKHLQDRLNRPQTRQLLSTTATRYPAAVVMLDLASEMLAGATMEDVSTVLYYKVLQWAGYSQNLKVAAFERKLQKDGRYEDFKARVREMKFSWEEVQNDPLIADSVVPELAHEFYPELFKSPSTFSTDAGEIVVFENERVREMIEIAREVTGKEFIIFVIDEVGQYVGSRANLILNLDGLAKNLRDIGEGKVWIMGTAQQTLTEDDPRSAHNSTELFKLKDRFPIQVDLESSDIREICYRRLLAKSAEGEKRLGALFDAHGQALRHHTKLEDARYYDEDFDRTTFVNLYPFLPAHFDVLLQLLSELAKSTGGIGLRSAIKVVQDILVEGPAGQAPVADRPVGWLATTVTLYDALEKDIRRAAPSIHKALGKVPIRFPGSGIHLDVAKTVAVLQILDNMPVTLQNVAGLMHPAVDAASRREEIDAAIRDLTADAHVPFGPKEEGTFCFFSEKLNDIDQERSELPLRSVELKRIQNDALKDAFTPLPATRIHGSLTVTSGLKVSAGNTRVAIAGDRGTIQTVVEFAPPTDYDTVRSRLLNESVQQGAQRTIFLLGRASPEIEGLLAEIFRSREIAQRFRTDPDQEVKEYCAAQADRAARLTADLERLLKRQLGQGSLIFRGTQTAAQSLDRDVLAAAKMQLAEVAERVFDRFVEAPVRADTSLAEQFLRAGDLRAVTSKIDPLGLVKVSGGTPRIDTDHKAMVSIRDHLDRTGTVDGKRLTEHFTDAPFGWSQDTLRYLVAAMLVAGEIKLKISGVEVTVNGQQAMEALRTNNAFRTVGVALRDDRPSMEMLDRAAKRLTKLVGDTVIPLEDEISKVAAKEFAHFQHKYGSLATRLEALDLPGSDTIESLTEDLQAVLLTDGSDAPQRLGGEESPLYEALTLASRIQVALNDGLESTIRELRNHCDAIDELPDSGVPGDLRSDLAEEIATVREDLGRDDFYDRASDLNSALTTIVARTRDAAARMETAQTESIRKNQEELQQLPDWRELTQEEQSATLAELDELALSASHDLPGLKKLLAHEFVIRQTFSSHRDRIRELAQERRLERLREEKEEAERKGRGKITREVMIPTRVTAAADLDRLIESLQGLRTELSVYSDIEVTLTVQD